MPIYCAYATIVIFNSQYLLLSVISVLYDFMFQKQPPRGVPRKRCSEKVLHLFRASFPESTSGGLLLMFI